MNLCTHHTSSGLLCIDQKELSQKKTRIDLLPSDNCSIQGFQPQSQSVCAKISLSEERERERVQNNNCDKLGYKRVC